MKLFKQHKPLLIFSVYRNCNDVVENMHNHKQVRRALTASGIGFKEVQGRFKGEYEQSFVVDNDDFDTVRSLCIAYQQACVLYLDEYRKAFLVDVISNESQLLGQWQHALGVADCDYTFDPSTKRHYAVR